MASQRERKDYTVTKSHGAVEGDLGTPGSLSSQDSLIYFCSPLSSHWCVCLTQRRERGIIKGWIVCVCVCVCAFVFARMCVGSWLGTSFSWQNSPCILEYFGMSIDRKLSKRLFVPFHSYHITWILNAIGWGFMMEKTEHYVHWSVAVCWSVGMQRSKSQNQIKGLWVVNTE